VKLPCRLVPVDSSRHMLWASMGIDIPGKTSRDLIRIINGVGSGYAVSTPAELDYIAHIARETSVVLDPVYTGKAALAMVQYVIWKPYMTNLCELESCSYTPEECLACLIKSMRLPRST